MKHCWRSNSTAADDQSGVGTFEFESGTVSVPFDRFLEFHRLTGLIERDINNAHWQGRKEVLDEISRIKP